MVEVEVLHEELILEGEGVAEQTVKLLAIDRKRCHQNLNP